MKSPASKRLAALVTFLVILLLDQGTKHWASQTLAGAPAQKYLGILTLSYAQNHGAWGSLGATWSPLLRGSLFVVFPALVLLILVVHIFRQSDPPWLEALGAAFLLAGGVGNLIDRVRFQYVVDFLYVGYGPVGTNIFNIADMVVLIGLGCLLWVSWQQRDKPEP